MRCRDALGKFEKSNAPVSYGGLLSCKLCGENKACSPENFRFLNGNKNPTVNTTCRTCENKKAKERYKKDRLNPHFVLNRKKVQKKHRVENREKGLLNNYKRIDAAKGVECNLTLEWVKTLTNQPCTYCGHKVGIGLDRVDNDQGHTVCNVVPCCSECNKARSNFFTPREMLLEIGPAIARVRTIRADNITEHKRIK